MKNKLIYVIIFLFVILIGITIYKYKVYDKNEKKHYFIPMMPSNMRSPRVKVTSNVKEEEKDKILYKEYIITDDLKEIEYTYIVNNNKSITGKIYIDDNKNLYITDVVNKKVYKPSNVKFKTMFKKDYPYNNIYIYLISEDNNLYFLQLTNNDINKTSVKQIFMPGKIYNFTKLEYTLDAFPNSNSLFVLADDDNVYDVATLIRYNKNILSMFDDFYVYDDNTITEVYGNVIVDKDNNLYKIKYAFVTFDNNTFSGSNTKLIITDNNDLIYEKDNAQVMGLFNKKVKDISFDEKVVGKAGKLIITFKDNYKIKLDAACNKYFCINEIEE